MNQYIVVALQLLANYVSRFCVSTFSNFTSTWPETNYGPPHQDAHKQNNHPCPVFGWLGTNVGIANKKTEIPVPKNKGTID